MDLDDALGLAPRPRIHVVEVVAVEGEKSEQGDHVEGQPKRLREHVVLPAVRLHCCCRVILLHEVEKRTANVARTEDEHNQQQETLFLIELTQASACARSTAPGQSFLRSDPRNQVDH